MKGFGGPALFKQDSSHLISGLRQWNNVEIFLYKYQQKEFGRHVSIRTSKRIFFHSN